MKNFINKLRKSRFTKWILATRKRKAFFVLVLLFVSFIFLRNYFKPDWELETSTVQRQTLVESISASGNITAEKFAELSFLSSENIQNILVEDNSSVYQGQVIAYLDTKSLVHTVAQAEADLRAREAALEAVYDELKGKDDSETFAEKSTRTTAEVAKDKAYDALIIARKNLSNATITAPFAGIVSFKSGTSIGKYSSPILPAFVVVDPTTLYFEATINEVDIPSITPGSKVKIVLDAYPDEEISASVKSISFVSTVSSSGGTAYNVRIDLPDLSDSRVRVGMNGDAEFIISENEGVLSIPQTAIVEEDSGDYVWMVKNGKAVKRSVEIGSSSIDDLEIKSGLEEGETIISRPPAEISEGDRIKLL